MSIRLIMHQRSFALDSGNAKGSRLVFVFCASVLKCKWKPTTVAEGSWIMFMNTNETDFWANSPWCLNSTGLLLFSLSLSHRYTFSPVLSFYFVIVSAVVKVKFVSIPIFEMILCGCNTVWAQYMACAALSKEMKVRFQTADSCILAGTSDDCTRHTPESSCPAKSSQFHTWKRFFWQSSVRTWPRWSWVLRLVEFRTRSAGTGGIAHASSLASGINIHTEPYGKAR